MSFLSAVSNVDSGALVCVITACGMSVAFLYADSSSRTTRMLSMFLVCIGVSIFLNVVFVRPFPPDQLPWASHLAPIFTCLSLVFGAEWILRIRQMVPHRNLRTAFGDFQFRLAQIFAVAYMVIGIRYNELRAEYFIGMMKKDAVMSTAEFWYFAAPVFLSVLCIMDGTLITFRRNPDRPEFVRLLGIVVASPLIASGLVLPSPLAAYVSALGQMVFLFAAVQYHVLQGQRAQFLTRFLAPSVAKLVKYEGMPALERQKLPIAVVACDLRGYTSFAQGRDSEEVIEVLKLFYDEVGKAAKEHEATIKDYAGDGVLMLLGAPLPLARHAEHAIELSASIRNRCQTLFAARGVPLGVGIGVASGIVSVGVIGGERMEYVAVGRAINLAARLCQSAASGEILLDAETLAQIPDRRRFAASEPMEFKGFEEPVGIWQLSAA